MCGFGGYIGPGTKEVLEEMTALLAHRGPDASGVWEAEGVGLAHRRLSIIDLSPAGNQPMANAATNLHLVYNGEIYNFKELRAELEVAGYRFHSRTDSEVLLHGYHYWGVQVLQRLRGMFAFAIWDSLRRTLFLARDRTGIKPLFYAPLDTGMVFASEIKALFAHPRITPELDPAAIDAYLTFGTVPCPRTIFQGVFSLPPGHSLLWKNGRLETEMYWSPDYLQPTLNASEDDLVDELDHRLNEAIRTHLVADVPMGAFLSGGVDSSLVAAIAQKHSSEPLQTFTIGYPEGGDERPYARQVATHIGSRHTEDMATPALQTQLPRLIWHLDQPLFDNSILPTFLVSQLASQACKVVLSGDGGDEPFFGYEWTRWAFTLPSLPLPSLNFGWKWLYRSGPFGLFQRLYYDVSHSDQDRYLRRMLVSASYRSWLYQSEFSRHVTSDPADLLRAKFQETPTHDPRDAFVHADLTGFLPDDILVKVDRMSMACGLEVRVPFLDHHLLDWVLRLPVDLRFRRKRGKYLLRRVAARYLPESIMIPRKQGFTVPVGEWLKGGLGDLARTLLTSPRCQARGFFRPERVVQIFDLHRSGRFDLGHRIWSLVVLEIWCRIWLDGQSPDQSLDAMVAED